MILKHVLTILGVTGGAMLATAATNYVIPVHAVTQITADWVVDLKAIITVGAVVLPATATVTAVFVKLTTRLAILEQRAESRDIQISLIHEKLDRLPCDDHRPRKH